MHQTALVLLPPVLVLICAMITQKLPFSLAFGLLSGVLIATGGAPVPSLSLLAVRLHEQIADPQSLYVYLFLICVGMLISIINNTGATTAFAEKLRANIANTKQVKSASLAVSIILSIDDYLNCLTVGHVMRPLVDSFHIARTKLAYIVHTFAGPLVMLIPISTWGAFITTQIEQTGISNTGDHIKIAADPFLIYVQSIPFIYYSLFSIVTVIFIINRSISYGPMFQFEQATAKQAPSATSSPVNAAPANAHFSDLLIPLCTLLASVFLGMLYMGNCYLFGGSESFICALQHNQNAFPVLGISGVITLTVSLILALSRKQIKLSRIPEILYEGIKLMWPTIVLVIFASMLGSVLRLDLQTGRYLASVVGNSLHITYLPLVFFIAGAVTSSLIGLGWGAIALLLPIGVPMAFSMVTGMEDGTPALTVIIPTIGAILAGSVFGDHTSPIAAAGIMAAESSGCRPMDHVRTQLPYAIPPFLGACVAYAITGALLSYPRFITIGISMSVGLLVTLSLVLFFDYMWHRKSA